MSSNEVELKAGHPPAEKVGGMRVSRPTRSSTGDKKSESEKPEGEEEVPIEDSGKEEPVSEKVNVDGAVVKEETVYSPKAVQHFHNKIIPDKTNRAKHTQQINTNINQPR